MATKGYSQQSRNIGGQNHGGSQNIYQPRDMMPQQPLPPAGYPIQQGQYPPQQIPFSGPIPGSYSARPGGRSIGIDRGGYYPGHSPNQAPPVPILNRNPYQHAPNGYPAPPTGPNPYLPSNSGYPTQQQQQPSMNQLSPSSIPILPPLDQQRSKGYRPQTVMKQQQGGPTTYQRGIIFPAKKIRHEFMHVDHSDLHQSKPHPYYPEHITTIRIRTPSQWGPSRLGTPTELRSTMTTEERYNLNPSKSAVSLEYEPYSHSDYLTMMSKYQNMRLPKGLGPTDDERWQKEHAKRHRMREYASKIKEMEQELKERRRTKTRVILDPKMPMYQQQLAIKEEKWRS